MTYDNNKHRIAPNGSQLLFDKDCQDCKCPRMADVWEAHLNIHPTDLRKTLNVEKLREVIREIIEEGALITNVKD